MITKRSIDDGAITEFVMEGEGDVEETIGVITDNYHSVSQSVLWNPSASNLSKLTPDDMRRIAAAAKTHAVHEKTAFYGASDSVFGMLRMYETHSELEGVPLKMHVFRDRVEAIEWLQK